MLLEDAGEAANGCSAGDEITMADFGSADARTDHQRYRRTDFAEAMIGNFDWCLRFTPGDTYRCNASKPLWNILAFEREDARALPVMHDFDLSGMVTGRHTWFDRFQPGFSGCGHRPEVEVVSQLQRTRTLFAAGGSRSRAPAVHRHQRRGVRRSRDRISTDTAARSSPDISRAFFEAIGTDAAFYRPASSRRRLRMPIRKGTPPACPKAALAPVGTIVGQPPLETRGDRVQVELLDTLWALDGAARMRAIRKGPVWIDANAISTDYPPLGRAAAQTDPARRLPRRGTDNT